MFAVGFAAENPTYFLKVSGYVEEAESAPAQSKASNSLFEFTFPNGSYFFLAIPKILFPIVPPRNLLKMTK